MMKKTKYFLLFLVWPFAQTLGQSPEIDSLVKSGYNKLGQNDYSGSLMEFEKALRMDDKYEKAVTGKINVMVLAGEIKDATDYIEEKIEKDPDEAIFYYGRGILFNHKKQFKKAIEDFDQALELDMKRSLERIYFNRGIAYENSNMFDDALMDFSTYLDYDEDDVSALYHRGFSNYQLENYNNAIDDFVKVIEKDDKNGYALYNLGMSYFRLNKILEACKNFQLACQLGNINACKMIVTGCTKN